MYAEGTFEICNKNSIAEGPSHQNESRHRGQQQFVLVLCLSGHNKKGANKNKEVKRAFVRTKEYVWCPNEDYVEGAN